MRIASKISIFFLITFTLLSTYTLAFAEAVGKYTFISGRVDVLKTGIKSAIPVEVGAPVSIGDIVRTKSNSRAEITFIDDTVVRLAQSTRIEITTYLFDEKGKRQEGILSLFRGKLRSIVPKVVGVLPAAFTAGGPRFEVHTPTSVTGVRGTDFIVFYLGRSGVVGSLFIEDSGYVFNKMLKAQFVIVREGQTTIVQPGKPPAPPRPTTKVEMIKLINDTSLLTMEPVSGESPGGPDGGEGSETSSSTGDEEGDTFGYSPPEEPIIGEEPEPPIIADLGTEFLPDAEPVIIPVVEPPITETEPDLLAPSTVTIVLDF